LAGRGSGKFANNSLDPGFLSHIHSTARRGTSSRRPPLGSTATCL
jgi:hypothetical protein